MVPKTCLTQGCHKPSIYKSCNKPKHNKTKYDCNWIVTDNVCLLLEDLAYLHLM